MTGYDPKFITSDVEIPLPAFNESLDVLKLKEGGNWRDYIHYSVAMNKQRRQPICVAFNINQKLIKSAERGPWKEDNIVGADFQLNNDYYKNNVWDRGHMARRSSAAWGETKNDAQAASDDTMYYTNACLQHANLNQDEWLDVENWVKTLQTDVNDKISVFSGPIYGPPDDPTKKVLQPSGREPAEIPAGFYKIVTYVAKDGGVATNAFIYPQDSATLKDKEGKYMRSFTYYQVTTTDIQEKTGIVFPDILKTSNKKLGSTPPVMIDPEDPNLSPEPPIVTDPTQIIIAAALVNPDGDDRAGEWVSIANYSSSEVSLEGWKLDDGTRKPLILSGKLLTGETIRLKSEDLRSEGGSIILRNTGGSLTLKDPNGTLVDRVTWSNSASGKVTIFNPF